MEGTLSEEELSLISKVRYPVDNKNIFTLLSERDRLFDINGNYTEKQLTAELKNPDLLPEYAQEFILSFREGKKIDAKLSSEDQLSLLYFEEMEEHSNSFLREWSIFELQLKNIVSAINCRKYDRDLDSNILSGSEISDRILKSSSADFSLSAQCPWAEPLFNLDASVTVTDFSKKIDNIRWSQVDEMPIDDVFSIDSVLGFCVKLMIVERWQQLDPQTGKDFLDKLINELEDSYLKSEAVTQGER